MRISVYGHTEKGPRHEANEDVILVGHAISSSGEAGVEMNDKDADAYGEGLLVAVADGMGSDAVGAAAARLTLERLDAYFQAQVNTPDMRVMATALYDSARQVNQAVLEFGARQAEYAGMACTLTGVVIFRDEYIIFNAGDSRVYRYSHRVLRQMTDDDSIVAEAVRAGEITLAEAYASEYRHFVTNAMGSESFQLRLGERQAFVPGDALLLCSDGLHNVVSLGRMERLLGEYGTAKGRCRALVESAIESGEYDDLSVIIVNAEE